MVACWRLWRVESWPEGWSIIVGEACDRKAVVALSMIDTRPASVRVDGVPSHPVALVVLAVRQQVFIEQRHALTLLGGCDIIGGDTERPAAL